jgi:hypothetical protein
MDFPTSSMDAACAVDLPLLAQKAVHSFVLEDESNPV